MDSGSFSINGPGPVHCSGPLTLDQLSQAQQRLRLGYDGTGWRALVFAGGNPKQ